MFLTTPSTGEILGEAFQEGIKEGFILGIKVLFEAVVQCAIDYPLLTVAVVAAIILNKKLKKK